MKIINKIASLRKHLEQREQQEYKGEQQEYSLSLVSQSLSEDDISLIIRTLQESDFNLTRLILSCCQIGDEIAQKLAKVFESPNCRLKRLDLSRNVIGDKGAQAFAEVLKDSKSKLNSLYLNKNHIKSEGGKAFADLIKDHRCRLVNLGLLNDLMANDANEAILDAVKFRLEQARENSDYLVPIRVEIDPSEEVQKITGEIEALYQQKRFEIVDEKAGIPEITNIIFDYEKALQLRQSGFFGAPTASSDTPASSAESEADYQVPQVC